MNIGSDIGLAIWIIVTISAYDKAYAILRIDISNNDNFIDIDFYRVETT